MAIFILIAVLTILGFMLAWITGMIANEEIDIKTGVALVIVTGIVGAIVDYAAASAGVGWLLAIAIHIEVWILILTGLLKLAAKIHFKKGLIISAIYATLTSLVVFGLSSCMQSAGGR